MRCKTTYSFSVGQKIVRKTFRFLWAFSVLILKLTLIILARIACALLGIEPTKKHFPDSKSEPSSSKTYVMYLFKSDANFETKKAFLKSNGYLWHSSLKAWALPTIKLDKNQPEFFANVSELKKLGYVWNKTSSLWELTFPKYQVIRVYQHRLITEAKA